MSSSTADEDDIYDFSGLSLDDLSLLEAASAAANDEEDDEDEGDWFPPTPPPYDVKDKLIEANRRLQKDPTSVVRVADRLRWRADSSLVDVRWLIHSEDDDEGGIASQLAGVTLVDLDDDSQCYSPCFSDTEYTSMPSVRPCYGRGAKESQNNLTDDQDGGPDIFQDRTKVVCHSPTPQPSPLPLLPPQPVQMPQSQPPQPLHTTRTKSRRSVEWQREAPTKAVSRTKSRGVNPASRYQASELEGRGRKVNVIGGRRPRSPYLVDNNDNSVLIVLPPNRPKKNVTNSCFPSANVIDRRIRPPSSSLMSGSRSLPELNQLSSKKHRQKPMTPLTAPLLQRKTSRNSLSSNSSVSTEDSAATATVATSSSDSSGQPQRSLSASANNQAWTQWKQRKKEEKKLRERRAYLLQAQLRMKML